MTTEPSALLEDLAAWRGKLLARLLQVLLWAGCLIGLPSIALAIAEGIWPIAIADTAALLYGLYLYRHRHGDPKVITLQLLTLLYLLGLVLLSTVGYVAQIYFLALPVLSVLLLSLRVAVFFLALSSATLLAVGVYLNVDAGMLAPGRYPWLQWLAVTLNFFLVTAALTTASSFLLRGMETVLQQQRVNARRLEYMAMHDALTGLANRRLLENRIGHALAQSQRQAAQVAVLLLDLDHFKNVNDSHGHALGDELIQAVGLRLQSAVRSGDTVARLGGDEFVVLLPEVRSENELVLAVERVLQSVGGEYPLTQQPLFVSASVGVAVHPRDGADAAELLKNADTAMYRAKESGRNRFQFFHAEMNARLLARMELEDALRHALERNELVLYYQPRVCGADGFCRSAEALIRWQHPQWGLVSPARFIPVAEDTGLIVPIGAWVLRTAAAQLRAWKTQYPQLRISVNLSAREFRDAGLDAQIRAATEGLGRDSLELEVTESLVMHNLQSAQQLLGNVREHGVGVALDDFGTGFSSLSYLKALPLDVLKIDQSFVAGIEHDRQDRAIVKTIVDLADNLQLATVAEGVETTEQAEVLRSYGVDELQGYLFARPLPVADFEVWLEQHYRR